jgi:hypothetical protein
LLVTGSFSHQPNRPTEQTSGIAARQVGFVSLGPSIVGVVHTQGRPRAGCETGTGPRHTTWLEAMRHESRVQHYPGKYRDRFNRLNVEGFTLSDGEGSTRHFEQDLDLDHKTRKALGGGTHRALLLVTLGIDEYDCHRVQLNFSPGQYDDGAHDAVAEAIDALEIIRQQLGVIASTPHAREAERNAFQLRADAERGGLQPSASASLCPPDM